MRYARSTLLLSAAFAGGWTNGAHAARPWTPADSVGVRYFVASQFLDGQPLVVSPRGTHLFVTQRRGDLGSDTNRYELEVFAAADWERSFRLKQRPQPMRRVALACAGNQPGINDPRWIDGGSSIAFLGVEGAGSPQVYRLEIASGAIARLTNVELGVYSYDVRGDSLAYFARVARRGDLNPAYYPGRYLDRSYVDFFDRHWVGDFWASFAIRHGSPAVQIGPTVASTHYFNMNFWISPDGNQAIMTTKLPPGTAPSSWSEYGPPGRREEEYARMRAQNSEREWGRFLLLDMRSGETRALFDAPHGWAVDNISIPLKAIWAPDSHRVTIVNTCLPLDRDIESRRHSAFVVSYDVEHRSFEILAELSDKSHPQESFVQKLLEGPPLQDGYVAGISQSPNEAPTAVVRRGRDTLSLSNTDPALRDLIVARIEPFAWNDARGRTWSAGLSRPPGHGKAGELPLVIQLAGFRAQEFRPDGSSFTAHAAQPLNARGFAVLQINTDIAELGTPEEGSSVVAAIDAAVAELSRRNVMDARKVGLVGFSRGGFLAQYAVTHPGEVRLAAAIAADAFSGGYFEYMHVEPDGADRVHFEGLYGGPFWNHQEAWLARAPTFNAHRSSTPLLLAPIGPMALLGTQELYKSLQLNHKPVELLYFPQGEHQLVRPTERVVSLEATVDWMSFWLQGYSDPSPKKEGQYRRWRHSRAARQDADPNS